MITIGTSNEQNRKKWLRKTLKKIPKGLKILDAGAGEQQFKPYCSHLKYVSQDFAQYDGKGDGKGLQTKSWNNNGLDIVCDITKIPCKDKSFDGVMCTEVFEHLPDPVKALQEFGRLIKKGGYLVITAPFCSLTHFAPYHFINGYNRYFYQHHLRELGFEILDIQTNGNYYEYIAQELHRIPKIASIYSGERVNIFEKIALRFVFGMLERFNKKNKNSEELLCFGYHIFAKKIRD
jgi:ubiquinone/menaquinone biosynthesis C-methylase UbiE